jgi:hypothetical protein
VVERGQAAIECIRKGREAALGVEGLHVVERSIKVDGLIARERIDLNEAALCNVLGRARVVVDDALG